MKQIISTISLCLFVVPAVHAAEPAEVLFGHVAQARTSYAGVRDYVCFFEKEEADKGKLDGKENIYLKFEKPFKIFMHWQNAPKKGLQVMYERGRHDGKLVIHKPTPLLALVPVIFLDQNSPWVRSGSKSYNIEDAGLGTFLEDFEKETREAAAAGNLRVVSAETPASMQGNAYDIYFENTNSESHVMAYHVHVVFDAKTGLPIYQELYDWNDQIKGRYYYKDLRLNVGNESSFQKNIHHSLYKIYNSKKD